MHDRRPVLHFTPQRHQMNDPNGLVFADGIWHLYFQYNPHGQTLTDQSWGHAISADLVHWQEQPVAILHQAERRMIISGSAVVDQHDGSGLGAGTLVAVYTVHQERPGREPLQTIELSYSRDGGLSFQSWHDNPLLDVRARKFGDPKVFRVEAEGCWLMCCILGWSQGCVAIYRSRNLLDWEFCSVVAAPGLPPATWECPDCFPLVTADGRQRWLLKVSLPLERWRRIQSAYVIGGLQQGIFTPEQTIIANDGDDYYAEITWEGAPDGRRIQIGWLRQNQEEGRPWKGQQSLPQELGLARGSDGAWRLLRRPVAEVLACCHEIAGVCMLAGGDQVSVPGVACRLRLRAVEGTVRLDLRCRQRDYAIELRPDFLIMQVEGRRVQRPCDGVAGERCPLPVGCWPLELWFDQQSLELFATDGCHHLAFAEAVPAGLESIAVTALEPGSRLHLEGIDAILT